MFNYNTIHVNDFLLKLLTFNDDKQLSSKINCDCKYVNKLLINEKNKIKFLSELSKELKNSIPESINKKLCQLIGKDLIDLLDMHLLYNDNDIILIMTACQYHIFKDYEHNKNEQFKSLCNIFYDNYWVYRFLYNTKYIKYGIDITDIMNDMLMIEC